MNFVICTRARANYGDKLINTQRNNDVSEGTEKNIL
jgi:hypothetical protein